MNTIQETSLKGYALDLLEQETNFNPQLLTNSRGQKVLSTIKSELLDCDLFWFSVAFVTTSGLASLKQELIELQNRKIRGKILVSQYLDFTQPEALKQLLMFDNVELRIATESKFHAKGYMFTKKSKNAIIIGSSNLTAAALSTNKEWNLKLTTSSETEIYNRVQSEFEDEFNNSLPVTTSYIEQYNAKYIEQKLLRIQKNASNRKVTYAEIKPNRMQQTALDNLKKLRDGGQTKGLLISATGTGKTYLSAFDALDFQPKRLLFIVHRENIAKAAMQSFNRVMKGNKTLGLYSSTAKDLGADYIFTTIQTISRDSHLHGFGQSTFDYIVIDETHRAQANSYQKVLNYFKPQFTLGMTATPERTDGLDVFQVFDHNVAYEIRLHEALESGILSPFHYYGVADITIDGQVLDDKANFNLLVNDQRIAHILEKTTLYGCDTGDVRGLVFCSDIKECIYLSEQFNKLGRKSIALTGSSSENQRAEAIRRLESKDNEEKLDYIFTVDIFNEGIDIPSVNQIVMLRPTQSAIIFVQQLGRGLRKSSHKDYLTVIDFIGNYQNNFLVPIALYGDTSYNKDRIRKAMVGGSNEIPGTSTINFESIAKERIFNALDKVNLQTKKDLKKDYELLKYKLGRIPTMLDFFEYGARDPFAYVQYSKSFFNFVASVEPDIKNTLSPKDCKLLELLSCEINNTKREVESIILRELLQHTNVPILTLKKIVNDDYGYVLSDESVASSIRNLNFEFITEKVNGKMVSVGQARDLSVLVVKNGVISFHKRMLEILFQKEFKNYLLDSTLYSIAQFNKQFDAKKYVDGFSLYKKYSRKDVFRILNWRQNPVAQNVGGYKISEDKTNCPIFVNYHKEEGISDTTRYEDKFISESRFQWMSKSKRKLNSPDVSAIREASKTGLRLPLFIKKSNDEGAEFYYMGDIFSAPENFEQTTMPTENDKSVSVVKVVFDLVRPVKSDMYQYLVS